MSLSQSPAYLAEHGIRAEGGPHDNKFLDDGHLLFRTVNVEGGRYKLRGRSDGSLVYVFDPHTHAEPAGLPDPGDAVS